MSKPSRKRGESLEYVLTETQANAALAACLDLTDRVILGLMLFCGLRAGEIVHFNSNWIADDGDLKIPSSQACNCAVCARHPRHPREWRPKTKRGARKLHIPSRLRKELGELLKMKPYGLGVSRVTIWNRTKAILKRANIKFKGLAKGTGFPHAIRATSLTMLAAGGTESAALAYFGGHNLQAAQHYINTAKAKPEADKKAKEVFG